MHKLADCRFGLVCKLRYDFGCQNFVTLHTYEKFISYKKCDIGGLKFRFLA